MCSSGGPGAPSDEACTALYMSRVLASPNRTRSGSGSCLCATFVLAVAAQGGRRPEHGPQPVLTLLHLHHQEGERAHLVGQRKEGNPLSAPPAYAPMSVMGLKHSTHTPDVNVFTNALCTTNCVAPLSKT